MKKRRAPDLTKEIIQTVLSILDGWKGQLTWDLLIAAAEETGRAYSRFTFAEYPAVANAFSLRKEALRVTVARDPSQPRDQRVRAALDQVDRYRAKLKRLRQRTNYFLSSSSPGRRTQRGAA